MDAKASRREAGVPGLAQGLDEARILGELAAGEGTRHGGSGAGVFLMCSDWKSYIASRDRAMSFPDGPNRFFLR
jgi:hypothetical protein